MTATRVEHECSVSSFHGADIYFTLVPCPSWTHRAQELMKKKDLRHIYEESAEFRQQLYGWLQKHRISDVRQMHSARRGLFGARGFSAPMIW
jgi:hypothetical protein